VHPGRGVAATIHGSARLTRDIDVVYDRRPENIARVVAALGPFAPYLRGAPLGLPFRWDTATVARGLNFILTTTLGDIDLLGEITGAAVSTICDRTRIPCASSIATRSVSTCRC
jgi:hypothetical protein